MNRPPVNPQIAMSTLAHAAEVVRQPENASADAIYATAAQFYRSYIGAVATSGRQISAHDVVELCGLLALAKSIHGDGTNPAHYVERAACAAGAAALMGAALPPPQTSENASQRQPQAQQPGIRPAKAEGMTAEEEQAVKDQAAKLAPRGH